MHSKYLEKMFDNALGDWSRVDIDSCDSTAPQPTCFDYFDQRFALDLITMSGFNRPICPLIEGP